MASDPMSKAERAFKKETERREGSKNLTDYQQTRAAEEKKTERLRALRLAHEAQQAEAGATAEAAKPARKKRAAPRKVTATVH